MNRFLIVRLSSLGDILHTLPAFSALRRGFPDAEISWLTGEKGKDILSLVPGIDNITVLPESSLKPGKKGFIKNVRSFRRSVRLKDRTALDFQGLIKSGAAAWLSGAERRLGFGKANCREPLAALFYTEKTAFFPETRHVIEKNLALLELLGIRKGDFVFPLDIPPPLKAFTRTMLAERGFQPGRQLILLNVGAAWETKRWFTDKWVQMIPHLVDGERFPLLLWGSPVERAIAEEIHRRTGVPLVPVLSIPQVMALIHRADLLISGDTFALQAACALDRPVVGLFGPTDPKRNGPFSLLDKVAFHPSECSLCYKRKCSDLGCLQAITPEDVAGMALDILNNDARINTHL
ncbi:MAG: glycosyltransferase family 9 protein [Acidobacteria bacterium]|nr:glycosyltransferase family 9 protein [Acidobacteriota bacterium]